MLLVPGKAFVNTPNTVSRTGTSWYRARLPFPGTRWTKWRTSLKKKTVLILMLTSQTFECSWSIPAYAAGFRQKRTYALCSHKFCNTDWYPWLCSYSSKPFVYDHRHVHKYTNFIKSSWPQPGTWQSFSWEGLVGPQKCRQRLLLLCIPHLPLQTPRSLVLDTTWQDWST